MFVKNYMSTALKCVNEDDSISFALDLMDQNNLHRLPVLKDGKLVGLITEGTIQANSPSNATSYSMFELNYLLSKTTVKDVMIKEVITCKQDDLLEHAAIKMRKSNIGCVPVMDGNDLVGIITINDILKAFIDLLGYYVGGSRYVITIHDAPGILEKVSGCFVNKGANISNLGIYHKEEYATMVIIAKKQKQIRFLY